MSISAKIVADSISPDGIRLISMQLRYPRFIHSEFMTHRDFTRNASSSRAIPVKRLIEDLRRDIAAPVHWGRNQSGMQARSELDPETRRRVMALWAEAAERAIEMAEAMNALGAHKQIVNRVLEPFAHINVLVTATRWANFFALRRHPDAQPEIKALADAMWQAQQDSTPTALEPGQWHLPYVTPDDVAAISKIARNEERTDLLIKVSVARCARVSYLTHEGKPTLLKDDLALYERLLGAQPMHASPAEHQATPDRRVLNSPGHGPRYRWERPQLHGNFDGWVQYRKTLPNEYIAAL